MAKKKTPGPAPTDVTASKTTSAPGARRRKSPATAIDQSPISETTAITSEEVITTANEMAAATPAVSTEALGSNAPASATETPSASEIAEAAYRRYLERGGTHGQDLEDWIAAERELRERRRQ